jgi:leucyl-tRNA synthetase
MDPKRTSHFITFAFPYMNGPLHLGHLYTLLQGWVAGKRLCHTEDTPMFLPFGFHCTGMPIYASAGKLAAGVESVKTMLLDMIIPEKDIDLFKEPEQWVRYFPTRGRDALKQLDLPGLDLNHGFVTTSVNSYFSSFVQWQFNKLNKLGLIYYGKRPCIYSVKDKQPCAAHDRQIGEDATIVKLESTPAALLGGDASVQGPQWLMQLTPSARKEYIDLCLYHQTDAEPLLVPSEKVISRSGDLCIVAVTEQWFLKYSDTIWKRQVLDYIENVLIIHDPEVKENLLAAANILHDWCFSREYGLGTPIPWDTRFMIDSLSDSTIYPVYYRFVDLLQKDLFGDRGILPIPDDDFWDRIFSDTIDPSQMINKFRSRIQPVDLRVSAKDLINNHLVMMIYNAIVIDPRLLPREYRINGYVRVNGEKMSKSLGNFVTIEDAITQYPKNPLLIALLEAGDGINDANARLSDIPAIEKSLKNTLDLQLPAIEGIEINSVANNSPYAQALLECFTKSQEAWSKGRNREALAYGWRKAYKTYEKYSSAPDTESLNYLCISLIRDTLSPIIGCSVELDHSTLCSVFSHINETSSPSPSSDHRLDEYLQKLSKAIGSGRFRTVKINYLVLDPPANYEKIVSFLKNKLPDATIIRDDAPIHSKRDPYKVKPELA